MPKITNPRSSYMTAEQYAATLRHVFGTSYQVKFADYAGLSKSQVNRYANAISPIPKHIVVMLSALKEMVDCGLPLPQPQPVPKSHADKANRKAIRAKKSVRRGMQAAAFAAALVAFHLAKYHFSIL